MEKGSGSKTQSLEIACDESGYEGERLIGGTTDVFAHASVRLSIESAADCIRELRDRIRSPAQEYKATHLLREKHRAVLEWMLGAGGPILGEAHVHLTDKAFLLVGKVIDLLAEDVADSPAIGLHQDTEARAMAFTLYRDGQDAFGRDSWEGFLESFNNLMRAKDRWGRARVEPFSRLVDFPPLDGAPSPVGEIMRLLWQASPPNSSRARTPDISKTIPPLDPLIPAIAHAVGFWSEGGRPVSVVHDKQNMLTSTRIARLEEILRSPHFALVPHSQNGRLTGFRLVDSRSDPRVQVADFLAGVARKIASDALNNRGDPQLTALLRPYVDSSSIWGDDRSWSLLGPHQV